MYVQYHLVLTTLRYKDSFSFHFAEEITDPVCHEVGIRHGMRQILFLITQSFRF